MTAKDLDDVLATIAAKTRPLREAGVVGRVTIGDVSFEISDIAPPVQASSEAPNPLDDADTYAGSEVPEPPWKRIVRQRQPEEEDKE